MFSELSIRIFTGSAVFICYCFLFLDCFAMKEKCKNPTAVGSFIKARDLELILEGIECEQFQSESLKAESEILWKSFGFGYFFRRGNYKNNEVANIIGSNEFSYIKKGKYIFPPSWVGNIGIRACLIISNPDLFHYYFRRTNIEDIHYIPSWELLKKVQLYHKEILKVAVELDLSVKLPSDLKKEGREVLFEIEGDDFLFCIADAHKKSVATLRWELINFIAAILPPPQTTNVGKLKQTVIPGIDSVRRLFTNLVLSELFSECESSGYFDNLRNIRLCLKGKELLAINNKSFFISFCASFIKKNIVVIEPATKEDGVYTLGVRDRKTWHTEMQELEGWEELKFIDEDGSEDLNSDGGQICEMDTFKSGHFQQEGAGAFAFYDEVQTELGQEIKGVSLKIYSAEKEVIVKKHWDKSLASYIQRDDSIIVISTNTGRWGKWILGSYEKPLAVKATCESVE
ncbi:hypothetical protein [Endozoicomonas sp. Mp262]|uniref:hypothetical protein n=1 Tax=Endozoicomonas sp. Mp262 TaxID=2919499 RepID=UPI0021D7D919